MTHVKYSWWLIYKHISNGFSSIEAFVRKEIGCSAQIYDKTHRSLLFRLEFFFLSSSTLVSLLYSKIILPFSYFKRKWIICLNNVVTALTVLDIPDQTGTKAQIESTQRLNCRTQNSTNKSRFTTLLHHTEDNFLRMGK